jgi:anti-sigma factor RsiW
MSAHLGHAATAFIDGELDSHKRDEVLAHLTHCLSCRSEVDILRRLKIVLRTDAPAVPSDLAARLLATVVVVPPVTVHVTGRRQHARLRLAQHARLRRTAMGGALLVLGLGGALSLAGPPPRGPVAPVDPLNASFVLDHGATSNEVPFTELDVVSASTSRSSR